MVELTAADREFLISVLQGLPLQGSVDGGILEAVLRIQELIAKLSADEPAETEKAGLS